MNIPVKSLEITQPQPYRYGADEFFALIDAGFFGDRKVELVEGELIELPPPGSMHSQVQGKIIFWLTTVFRDHAGLWVGGDTGIEIDGQTVIGCDAVVASSVADNRSLSGDQLTLAVEVSVSTTAYDLGRKKRLYARAGVVALWVVDPQAAVVHSFADPEDGDYREAAVVRFGEPLSVPGTDQTIVID